LHPLLAWAGSERSEAVMGLAFLNQYVHQRLPGANLRLQTLPGCGNLKLYLLDPAFDDRELAQETKEQISDDPPYWIFCWASGRAMAERILAGDIPVKGKAVVDFGAGSGVVAIAAKLAGARMAIACEIDPVANRMIALNAEVNDVRIEIIDDLDAWDEPVDLLLGADVLYERANLSFLDMFLRHAPEVVIADSRQKTLSHNRYCAVGTHWTTSFPDFAEAREFNEVTFYSAK